MIKRGTPENPERILSFTDHLQELRVRILICIAWFVLTFAVGLYFSPSAIGLLTGPLSNLQPPAWASKPVLVLELGDNGTVAWKLHHPDLSTTNTLESLSILPSINADQIVVSVAGGTDFTSIGRSPTSLSVMTPLEPFYLLIMGALLFSLAFSIPMIVYQAWLFVAPGLNLREKKAAFPLLLASVVLFPLGAGFAYLVTPMTFLAGMQLASLIPGMQINLWASRSLDLIMMLMLIFGLLFEFPLVLVLLARVGLINSQFLVKRRRMAIVLLAAVAAIATPSQDPFTMLLLWFPLIALYEGALWAIRFTERKSNQADLKTKWDFDDNDLIDKTPED